MFNKKIKIIGVGTIVLGSLFMPIASNVSVAESLITQQVGYKQDATNQAPQLIDAGATEETAGVSSTYYFTIKVPENATYPLKAVAITQNSGTEEIDFIVSESEAVMGDNLASGTPIPLAAIGGSAPEDVNEVMLVFEEAVEPGNTVTVAVDVKRNPKYGGVYQFGVTAFPPSETSPSLYLGSARIDFLAHN